jgi:hypothetical protein
MKKLTTILMALMMMNAFHANSQAYEQGRINVDLTTGFIPLFGSTYHGYGLSFPIMVAAEYGATENISIGGYFGYRSSRYKSIFLPEYRIGYSTIGGKANFHVTNLINKHLGLDLPSNELDLYGGAHLGFTVNNSRRLGPGYGVVPIYPQFGIYLGAKYFFTPKLGAVFEFGATPIGIANFGLTIKI